MCRSAIIRKKTIDCFLFVLTILFSIKSEQCVRITCLIFVDSTSCQQWLFSRIRVNTKRVTRLLLPWRPCLDSKLWTKSRSDIKRAFGTQIISRPESCCCLNNVNKKVDRKMRMENGVEEEGIVNAKASFISKRNHRSCKKRLNWRYCLSLEQ